MSSYNSNEQSLYYLQILQWILIKSIQGLPYRRTEKKMKMIPLRYRENQEKKGMRVKMVSPDKK